MARSRETKIELTAYDDLFQTDESREEAKLSKIRDIPISEIDEFPDHPFKVLMDEDMEQLVESIKRNGVMTPATVRLKEDGRYELISGHRRKKACELAGLETLKCEVKELTRDEAIIVMVESNLQRSVILPSEKAFAYKMRLEAMKRQAGRPPKENASPCLMNTAVNEYNYRFKLTDYSLFDRNRARKVAIYGRVSTEHEAQLSALENQLQWYDDQVKYHPNWTVCERYIDEGITGTQAKKRPAFLKMIEDAKQGKFDLIVTREVCRFARNVVDTLVVTRELKGIGVEVFFIDDNIWTMDGDGELRLSLMATLAQEESRKTSERVKAGQKISRDNGVLYGNGNILGYDRVGDTYVINEEQAETVRMIYDLYLQGYGSMKIAKILTERKRKTASGLIKWSVSNIMRAIKNATYTGTKCYNKSRSNNFLEQKRINNLDMSTYEYVEGDFPSIISQEIWNKAQAIRESRVKPVCVSAGKNTHSKRDSRDIWVNKLRCSCGSSYRKNKWHTKLDGKTSYGYQCYNQLNNGIKRKRAEIGLDTEGYCDSRMITDWKLDFMAKALLEHLWTERKESVLIALDLIKYYYKEEKSNETQSDTVTIQAKLDKANSRLTNLIAMRADGEISKDEYQAMRSPVDEEIKKLQKALDEIPQEKSNPKGLDIEGIRSTLNSFIDFSGSTISHDVVNQFVYLITPTSDTTFDWYVNLNGTADVKATFTAEGRKKNCIIKLEEIEKISSVHREKNEDNAHFIKNPHIFTYLHRQLSLRRMRN